MQSIEEAKDMIAEAGEPIPNDAESIQVEFKYDI